MFRHEQGSYKQIAGGDLGNGLIDEDYVTSSGTVYGPDFGTDTAYKKVPTEHFEIAEPVLNPRLLDRLETWKRQRLLTGWRFGAISAAAITSCVFLINLIVTIWAVSITKVDSDGKSLLYDGSCSNIKQLNTNVHLLINVLSTFLLSGSNYCMQCLSAPTRPELDRAHMQKKWLDIGIPSVRNLTRISRKRALLWIILGTSSLPLHLLGFEKLKNVTYDPLNLEVIQKLHKLAKSGELYSLTPSACIAAYAKLFQSERGNLLLVSFDDPAMREHFSTMGINSTMHYHNRVYADRDLGCPPDNFAWICGLTPCDNYRGEKDQFCSDRWSDVDATNWAPFGYKVDLCLSDMPPEHCRLQFSLHIAILVIFLNLIKALAMAYTAFGIRENPLMTVGDAVASYILALALVGAFLGVGVASIPGAKDFTTLAKLGLSTVSSKTLIVWGVPSLGSSGLIANVVLANLAQPILSFLYFSYNGLITCFLLAYEWSQYAMQRKGLRVSNIPHGSQRSTYFLQLPYRFAMPLLAVSGILHWLASQSIFLVSLEVYDPLGHPVIPGSFPSVASVKTCGYSPIAMVCVLCIGVLLILFGFILGLQKFKSGMPVASSCSAAIAAACHPSPNEKGGENPALLPLQWGVTEKPGEGDVYGHIAFSSGEVEEPVEGFLYAGRRCWTAVR
ncbi:hypothetical protein H2199_002721 [Coniosporium tulheliwenetii]|uniref:Uncharacterized protein n=1 Tax=Coniosporium tulheliwenetii TaxID=3383036 RepID=A0ACC2ZFA8_9PEZI|nr:hypothetical protein H2199_002721 [Cladosporium sp. JES 115]